MSLFPANGWQTCVQEEGEGNIAANLAREQASVDRQHKIQTDVVCNQYKLFGIKTPFDDCWENLYD